MPSQQFFHKGNIRGLALNSICALWIVSSVDVTSVGEVAQAASIFLGSKPALLLLNHKVGSKMHEHEKRMLQQQLSAIWSPSQDRTRTYQSAMHNPQIALVSRQLSLVEPAQTYRPMLPPCLTFCTRLCNQDAAPAASVLLSAVAMAKQFSRLSGLPRVTETTTKARRRRLSMPVMMNKPKFA